MENNVVEMRRQVAELSAYRDLATHPGYRQLLDDLKYVRDSILNKMAMAVEYKDALRYLREWQVTYRLLAVMETQPDMAAKRLEEIVGEVSTEYGFTMRTHPQNEDENNGI